MRCWKCCPSSHRRSSHWRKRFWFTIWHCSTGNICNFPMNIFFYFFCSGITVVNFVCRTAPEEKITRIKIRWRNSHAQTALLAVKLNAVKRFSKLMTLGSRCLPLGILTGRIRTCLAAGGVLIGMKLSTKITSQYNLTAYLRILRKTFRHNYEFFYLKNLYFILFSKRFI
jgi:hypothetical protein